MKLTTSVVEFITSAGAKALATSGPAGINVVPVSAIHADEESIRLYDFFMCKTADNLREGSEVALVAWEGLAGVQIKCTSEYLGEGEDFAKADSWAKETFPDRNLCGLIVLKPKEVHDISIAGNRVV